MKEINFNIPLRYLPQDSNEIKPPCSHKLLEFIDDYFSWTSHYYKPVSSDSGLKNRRIIELSPKEYKQSGLMKFIKIMTYLTGIIPIIMIFAKLIYRGTIHLELENKKNSTDTSTSKSSSEKKESSSSVSFEALPEPLIIPGLGRDISCDEFLFYTRHIQIHPEFTTIHTLEEQIEAHDRAKAFLQDSMKKLGGSVDFVVSQPRMNIPDRDSFADITDLDKDLFFMELTAGVGRDIQNDAKKKGRVVLYGVASQFNGGEAPSRRTVSLDRTIITYRNDGTQGPQAQLQFPDGQILIINLGAHLGYNGLCRVLDEDTKNTIQHGYFTPTQDQRDLIIALLKDNGHLIEYPCYGNIPKGDGNSEKVYEMLAAAPAFGRYNQDLEPEEQEEIQYLCAVHSFRAQFHEAIKLAKENPDKQLIFKPTGVGLGVFGNDEQVVAKAFYVAAKEYEKRLKKNNVQVRFQVYYSDWERSKAGKLVKALELSEFVDDTSSSDSRSSS